GERRSLHSDAKPVKYRRSGSQALTRQPFTPRKDWWRNSHSRSHEGDIVTNGELVCGVRALLSDLETGARTEGEVVRALVDIVALYVMFQYKPPQARRQDSIAERWSNTPAVDRRQASPACDRRHADATATAAG